jgi:Uma2 family endonuclease
MAAAEQNLGMGMRRMPSGRASESVDGVAPDVVLEVRSSRERWVDVIRKVAGYLNAGVGVVRIIDPGTGTAYVYSDMEAPRVLAGARGTRD